MMNVCPNCAVRLVVEFQRLSNVTTINWNELRCVQPTNWQRNKSKGTLLHVVVQLSSGDFNRDHSVVFIPGFCRAFLPRVQSSPLSSGRSSLLKALT
eukprot:jgi/Psemu1/300696/fgenesh1_kg.16_\